MKTIVIIPAGGSGFRAGGNIPKQFMRFNNKTMIAYTLEVFQKNKLVDEIVISSSSEYHALLERTKKKYGFDKVKSIVKGGKERQHSVFNALSSIYANKKDLIVIHDAARPLLPDKVLTNAIRQAKKKGNALVCLKASDTLVRGNETVRKYLKRDEVFYVQTPQIFKYAVLMEAMQNAKKQKFTGTDESVLVKKLGKKINIVEGSPFNFKITTKNDIELFKRLIMNS